MHSRYRESEVLTELCDFLETLVADMRRLIQYHRYSAYKTESLPALRKHMIQAETLVRMINDEALCDVLADFELVSELAMIPGQFAATDGCSYSHAVSLFVQQIEPAILSFKETLSSRTKPVDKRLMEKLSAHRRDLLSVCKVGSRSWELLKSM